MSTKFLVDHAAGCRPLAPCTSCRMAAFLRTKLSEEDLQALLAIASEAGEKVGRALRNPKGKSGVSSLLSVPSVDDIGLSTRGANCLKAKQILTLDDVSKRTEAKIAKVPGFGTRSQKQLKKAMQKAGRKYAKNPVKAK